MSKFLVSKMWAKVLLELLSDPTGMSEYYLVNIRCTVGSNCSVVEVGKDGKGVSGTEVISYSTVLNKLR